MAASAQELYDALSRGQLPVKIAACIHARAVFASVTAKEIKAPAEKHLIYLVVAVRDRLRTGQLSELWWIDTRDMVTDALTKGGIDRNAIRKLWQTGEIHMKGDTPLRWTAPLAEKRASRVPLD